MHLLACNSTGVANQSETKSHIFSCVTAKSHIITWENINITHRTVARKSSIRGIYVCAGGLYVSAGGLDIQI